MNSRDRQLTAWSMREPDRVPIELLLSDEAAKFPEAERIMAFISADADNFGGAPGADFGFLGLPAAYSEEVLQRIEAYIDAGLEFGAY
jgi:hypothetical protein